MRDARGSVIYVGKAKSLRSRVRSYFTGVENHPPRTKKLIRDVRDVTWRETGTELAALLEESRLIKTHLPVHNRALRRYRDYPFLRLDTTHRFPSISWTPRIAHDGAEYYGPLGRRAQAEELVELIGRLFRLRECADTIFQLGRPCLYHDMGRCGAPCAGFTSPEAYDDETDRVRAFLSGRDTEALATVEEAMRDAAASLDFESAGWYRDQLRRLERTMGRQRQVASAVHEHDAVLVEPLAPGYDPGSGPGQAYAAGGAQLFLIRFGRLAGRFDLAADVADDGALEAALAATFDPSAPPPESHLRPDVDEMRILAVDEMRILAAWMRLHPDDTRQVRWTAGDDPHAFAAAVRAAAAVAAPDDAPPVEEEDE
jgi:DNA polymerase-3 subunit epsilon